MPTIREQFISKSQERRITAMRKAKPAAKPATCPYFSTPHGMPYSGSQTPCGKPLFAEGQHGHLCKDHRLQQESILDAMRKESSKPIVDVDMDQVVADSIIAYEQHAIASGKIERIRFGSCKFDPVYFHFWSAN